MSRDWYQVNMAYIVESAHIDWGDYVIFIHHLTFQCSSRIENNVTFAIGAGSAFAGFGSTGFLRLHSTHSGP